MRANRASGGSIYAPALGTDGEVKGLVFVCIEPLNDQTRQLRKKIIPLKSLAGRCLKAGESVVVSNAAQQKDHFKEAERISDYRPSTTLNIALKHEGRTVGVLQLLSREGEKGFTEQDLRRVAPLCDPIAELLDKLIANSDFVKVLNLADDAEGSDGSVIIFDLTRSSMLFQEFSPSFALKLMNEYFESLCDVAFAAGAVLDNYMGDGALLRFNVARPQPDHELAAVKAALAMTSAFDELQSYWMDLSPVLGDLHYRAGVSSGPLLRGNLGHSQFQRLTILGHPISVAAALCSEGDRDRSVILVSEETHRAVKGQVISVSRDLSQLGKVNLFTRSVYEIQGLR
jgi:class 3 adenylate cyclase